MKTTQGFILPTTVAADIVARIAAATDVWRPYTHPLPDGTVLLAASPALFETQLDADRKLGDTALASELLTSLGGWGATVQIEIAPPPD